MKFGVGAFSGARVALLLASTALASPAFVSGVSAQQQVSYSIPAGTLGPALTVWARTSGLKVLASSAVLGGRATQGLSGQYAPQQALSALLAGTGLTYNFDGATVTIIDPNADTGAAVVDGDTIQLETIEVAGQSAGADRTYETPGSVGHISAEQIEHYRGTTPGDILKGVPGVMSGANRTSGGVDVNIQGLQGMGRVAVTVDGASNAMTTYHGYQGVSNRSYIDPDFIGGINVEKGPRIGAQGVGAIGGTVSMRTIDADDIIPDGQNAAVRVKAEIGTNTSDPYPVGTRTLTRSHSGYLWTANPSGTPAPPVRDIDRPGLLEPTSGAGSVVLATRSENIDLVFGAARRKSGNYHVGENGDGVPRRSDVCSTNPTGQVLAHCNRGGIPYDLGLTTYLAGEQVLNTSQDIFSTLAKVTLHNEDHRLELIQTHYDSIYGETYPFGFVTTGHLTDQNITSTAVLDTYASRYRWNPENDLLDLKLNASFTNMDQATPAGVGGPSLVDVWAQMTSADVSNTSRFETGLGSAALTYGATVLHEATAPNEGNNSTAVVPREGDRTEIAGFVNGTLKPWDWLELRGGLRYHYFETEDKSGSSLVAIGSREDDAWDYSLGASVTPFEGVQLFANYRNAARMPSLYESISNTMIIVDPDLGPERASSWDVGANLVMDGVFADDDDLKVKLSYFNNTVDDYIYRRATITYPYPSLPTYAETVLDITNLDKARFSGVELSGQYDVGSFSALLSATYYDNIEFCRTPDTCLSSSLTADYANNHVPPEFSASLTLSQKLLDDRLTLSGRATYYGKRAAGAEPLAGGANPFIAPIAWDAALIFDAYADYKLTDNTKLSLSIENLADEYYVDPLSLALVPSPGRTIKLGFSGTFDPAYGFGNPGDVAGDGPRDWSGFFAGGHLGIAAANNRIEDYMTVYKADALPTPNITGPQFYEGGSNSGLTGGVRAGYNHQFGNKFLLGVDVEASWGEVSLSMPQDDGANSLLSPFETTYDLIAAAHLRAGIAAGNALLYGKAGLAVARMESFVRYTAAPWWQPAFNDFEDSATAFGVSLGAGLEYALTDRISVFGEYQHMRLGAAKVADRITTVDETYDYSWDNRSNIDLFKAGVNFHF